MSFSFMENLNVFGIVSAPVNSSDMPLRIKTEVELKQSGEEELNLNVNGEVNVRHINSLDRSRNSSDVIENLDAIGWFFPPR